MQQVLNQLRLRRTGDAQARVGMISLPLPRELAGKLRLDHPRSALVPVGWWQRHQVARRAIAYVIDEQAVPEALRLTESPAPARPASHAWQARTTLTVERRTFVAHPFTDVDGLRGVPAADCATSQGQLELTFNGRTLIVQSGATGPRGGPYYWENVQIDHLWSNAVAQAIRVGGVIYNEDTYLWADLYFVLFANGVADVAAHFVVTKLHIKGYDFHGLPMLRLAGTAIQPVAAQIPRDGWQFDLGQTALNLKDSEILCSEPYPGRLESVAGDVHYYPVSRTFHPQLPDAGPTDWSPGFARTVRFQVSLSDAPPLVARYVAPSWWYALSGEPWTNGLLPVHGLCDRLGETVTDQVRASLTRGRFDGGCSEPFDVPATAKRNSGNSGNDGDAGFGMMLNYYQTGRPEILTDTLSFCYFWADLMVDHTDFTVHQWVGGWPWKTCAYAKFRDVLMAYLETGDPYLLDTCEMAADAYWAWHRGNWPRSNIGRDNFELGATALLWRYLDSQQARERALELARMTSAVLDSRGHIGGQMGAGPHPGFIPALYMTAVTMISLLETADTAAERRDPALANLLAAVRKNHAHFQRDDVEMFPSNPELTRTKWGPSGGRLWVIAAIRIYSQLLRLGDLTDPVAVQGLRRVFEEMDRPPKDWPDGSRLTMYYANPIFADAMLLGARLDHDGVLIAPAGPPEHWPAQATVETPWGPLRISLKRAAHELRWQFAADREFPVRLRVGHQQVETTSTGQTAIARSESPQEAMEGART